MNFCFSFSERTPEGKKNPKKNNKKTSEKDQKHI